ncbi:uncharacterized TPR repeat-containing protein At2g32450-like [Macadamia integrifolia]|uniref:uncharacterized TPR repeat-containing protein At2g32450-like n=1 Tax=Macadamia integrifolia TaxID=60698 RepID=UPI001C4E4869|nr:uncharacterized TPR repeat-containing protein At2g32450-like [Macadamia integrifolia]
MASLPRSMSTMMMSRRDKVSLIFDRFDINRDGGLNREEMGALVTAVNPNVKFSSDQIFAILDEVFRSYSDLIENPLAGLSFNGLLRTYDDGAGDVDRDYSALFPSSQVMSATQLDAPSCSSSSSMIGLAEKSMMIQKIPNLRVAPAWAKSPNHGVHYDNTWKLVEDLEIIIRRKIKSCTHGHDKSKYPNISDGFSDIGWSTDFSVEFDDKRFFWDENCADFRTLLKEVRDIRVAVDRNLPREEAFDRHMAIGRTLYDYKLLTEALQSFQRGADLSPIDVRPHFRLGNCLCLLGRLNEAKVSYMLGLELAETTNSNKWLGLLPQVHVNLGIVLEGEGMLLSACEHYREAAILCPTHYRALKLLGSALFGVGEYRAAEKALEEAVFLNPEFSDAHCDLGSVLHAVGEDERAILEFQRAIDLNPSHLDALYNLGCLFRDVGRYQRAAEMYGRVLGIQPNHWRAQVNRAVSLLGAGEAADAKKALREALKMTNRVELYDAMAHMKKLQKKNQGGRLSSFAKNDVQSSKNKKCLADGVDVTIVEASNFKRASEKTTRRECLADALHIRDFQRITRLHRCDVSLLNKETESGSEEWETHVTDNSESEEPEKSIKKAALEVILRKLLHFLKPEAFQGAVKAVDRQILSVLDATSSGRVDLGMFYAVIAPICAGETGNRKRAAFDALLWRSRKEGQGVIGKVDALIYMRYLRLIYFPSQGCSDQLVAHVEEENTMISFPEFLQIFDDDKRGFGILSTLVNLEKHDRIRHGGHSCDACRYPIIGPRFKEMTSHFSLCMNCYSHGNVPSKIKREQYRFKEYWSEAEVVKDKLKLFR